MTKNCGLGHKAPKTNKESFKLLQLYCPILSLGLTNSFGFSLVIYKNVLLGTNIYNNLQF